MCHSNHNDEDAVDERSAWADEQVRRRQTLRSRPVSVVVGLLRWLCLGLAIATIAAWSPNRAR